MTAKAAENLYEAEADALQQAKDLFNNTKDLVGAIQKVQDELAAAKKRLEEMEAAATAQKAKALLSQITDFNGIQLLKLQGEYAPTFARDMVATLKQQFDNTRFALVAATQCDGKPALTVYLSQPLVAEGKSAGNMIKAAARFIQGGGGGQPALATAGGRDVNGLQSAMDEMLKML